MRAAIALIASSRAPGARAEHASRFIAALRASGQDQRELVMRRSRWSRPAACAWHCCASNIAWKLTSDSTHRREAGAGADVGDDRAQVRDRRCRGQAMPMIVLQLLFGDVADLEDAGLLGLDQEQQSCR